MIQFDFDLYGILRVLEFLATSRIEFSFSVDEDGEIYSVFFDHDDSDISKNQLKIFCKQYSIELKENIVY